MIASFSSRWYSQVLLHINRLFSGMRIRRTLNVYGLDPDSGSDSVSGKMFRLRRLRLPENVPASLDLGLDSVPDPAPSPAPTSALAKAPTLHLCLTHYYKLHFWKRAVGTMAPMTNPWPPSVASAPVFSGSSFISQFPPSLALANKKFWVQNFLFRTEYLQAD